jgi:hypothetical protein
MSAGGAALGAVAAGDSALQAASVMSARKAAMRIGDVPQVFAHRDRPEAAHEITSA